MKLRNKIYTTFALMVAAVTFCTSSIRDAVAQLPPVLGLDMYAVFAGVIYFVLSIWIMEYFVLFRIEQLKNEMEAVQAKGYNSKQKIYSYSKDELGTITNGINCAIEELSKQMQKAETKNKLYASLINDKSIYAYRFNTEGKITFINKTFANQFNREHKDLLGKDLFEFIETVGFDAEEIKKSIALLNPSAPSSSMIFDMPTVLSSGIPRWIAWTVSAAFDKKGAAKEYQVVGVNMHKPADELRSERVFDQKGTILLNIDGQIDYMFNMFNCQEGIGENLLDYIHESDRWIAKKAISRILTHRNESLINARIKIKDEYVYAQMNISCSTDKEDNIKNIVIHAVDMTEVQWAQEKVVGAVNDMNKILEQRF